MFLNAAKLPLGIKQTVCLVPAQAAASGQVKPGTAPTPTQGVSSEKGGPTMGGGQGPGGGGAASGSGPSGSPSGNTP